jgi:hypothetical protein
VSARALADTYMPECPTRGGVKVNAVLNVGKSHYLYVTALGGATCGKCGEPEWPCAAEQERLKEKNDGTA